MMIWERVKVFLALSVCLIFFSGCAGNLFKGMDSVGSDPGTRLKVAKMALDQGNYPQAKNEAQAILDDPTATAQHNDAKIVRAQALLGEEGLNAPDIMSKVLKAAGTDANDFKTLYDVLPDANLEIVKQAAAELQAADLQDDPNIQLTTGVASGVAAVLEVMRTFDTNGDGKLDDTDEAISTLSTDSTAWDNIKDDVISNATAAVENLDSALGVPKEGEEPNESITDLLNNADNILAALKNCDGSADGIAGLDD